MSFVKQAIIVYGKRFVGKNYTLNCHVKPLLKLKTNQRIFDVTDPTTHKILHGEIRTQSFEDAGYSPNYVSQVIKNKLSLRDLLIIVTLPPTEDGSLFNTVKKELCQLKYQVNEIEIVDHGITLNPHYYAQKAQQICNHI